MTTYSIRDASRLSGLPASTIRYYESIGILDPPERNTSSNHRVYYDGDLGLLEAISCLNATGLSLDDMREYMRNRLDGPAGAARQVELMTAHCEHLAEQVRQLELRQQYVDLKIRYWQAIQAGDEARAKEIVAETQPLIQALTNPQSHGRNA